MVTSNVFRYGKCYIFEAVANSVTGTAANYFRGSEGSPPGAACDHMVRPLLYVFFLMVRVAQKCCQSSVLPSLANERL